MLGDVTVVHVDDAGDADVIIKRTKPALLCSASRATSHSKHNQKSVSITAPAIEGCP